MSGPLRFALIFTALTAALLGFALAQGGWLTLLLWPAAGTSMVALAYFGERPRLLGKGEDGRIALWSWALGLPVHGAAALIWQAQRLSAERFADEVAPGIWVGRRPHARDLKALANEQGITLATIVDLTAEFAAAPVVRAHPGYRCAPMLDGTLPEPARVEAIVRPLVTAPDQS